MFPYILFLILFSAEPAAGGYALAAPSSSGYWAMTWGFGELHHVDRDGNATVIDFPSPGWTSVSALAVSGDTAALRVSRSAYDMVLVITGDSITEEYGPYSRAGAPVFSRSRDLWFTADGTLHRNGISTGTALDAYTIAVDGNGSRVAFCDEADRLLMLNINSGDTRILAEHRRFYSPMFISFGAEQYLISPSLDGEILLLDPESGARRVLAEGTHPCWMEEEGLLLYSVTEDDGHMITSGEIWAADLKGNRRRLTFTPEVHEILPFCSGGVIEALNAETGAVVQVEGP